MRIWSLQNKTQEAVLQGHLSEVFAAAITRDSKYIVSGGADSTLRKWNFKDRRQETVLRGHIGSVLCVAITSDSKYIVSGGRDNSVRIWNFHAETLYSMRQV